MPLRAAVAHRDVVADRGDAQAGERQFGRQRRAQLSQRGEDLARRDLRRLQLDRGAQQDDVLEREPVFVLRAAARNDEPRGNEAADDAARKAEHLLDAADRVGARVRPLDHFLARARAGAATASSTLAARLTPLRSLAASTGAGSAAAPRPWRGVALGLARALGAQARAQRFDQVDHLRPGLRLVRLGGDDVLAGDLLVDRGEDALLLLVLEHRRVVGVLGDLLDQLHRQLELGRRDRDLLDVELLHRAHFVGVEQLLQHQAVFGRAHLDHVLLGLPRPLGERAAAARRASPRSAGCTACRRACRGRGSRPCRRRSGRSPSPE